MSMTNYIIELLTKVSFDRELFLKELNKSRRWLNQEEWSMLIRWVHKNHMDKVINTDIRFSQDNRENIFREL